MPAILMRPEWWNWAMFAIIPLLLILLAVSIWSILSGMAGLFRTVQRRPEERGTIPDIMTFLKERYSRRSQRFLYEQSRRPLIRR
jgi:hypothetical protein